MHKQNNSFEHLTTENLGDFKWLNEPKSFEVKRWDFKGHR